MKPSVFDPAWRLKRSTHTTDHDEYLLVVIDGRVCREGHLIGRACACAFCAERR
jgi:hypothetical protein